MTNGSSATVRLHVKVLSEPTAVTRDTMVAEMTTIYGKVGIDVVVASTERLDLPVLNDLYVGACAMGSTTPAQDELSGHRNHASPHEICIYFVRSTFMPLSGCGAFPADKPGAVVASYASPWTLGHECGHVLGLSHVEPPHRLMAGAGTSYLPNPPPMLTQTEANTMIASLNH